MRVQWRSDSMFKRGEKEMMTRDAPVLPYQPFTMAMYGRCSCPEEKCVCSLPIMVRVARASCKACRSPEKRPRLN